MPRKNNEEMAGLLTGPKSGTKPQKSVLGKIVGEDGKKPLDYLFFNSQYANAFVAILLLVHIMAGSGLFYSLNYPNWTFVESLYFVVQTVTTVGYGDYTPTRNRLTLTFGIIYVWLSMAVLTTSIAILGIRSSIRLARSSILDNIVFPLLQILIVVLTGTICFPCFLPGWSYLDSLYFSTITLSTVGYGSNLPKETSRSFRIFTIVYILVGVVVISNLIGNIINYAISSFQASMRRNFYSQALTMDRLKLMQDEVLKTSGGGITWSIFLTYMITETGLVERSEVDELKKCFDEHDVDGNGELSPLDIILAFADVEKTFGRSSTEQHLSLESPISSPVTDYSDA